MPVSSFSLFRESFYGLVTSTVNDNNIELGQENSSSKINAEGKWFGDNVFLVRTRQPMIIIFNTSNYTFIKISLKYNIDSDEPAIAALFNLTSWDALYTEIGDQLLPFGFSYNKVSKQYIFEKGFSTPENGSYEGEHDRSVDLYLGDHVTIKDKIVDIGHSILTHLVDGIDDEDAVNMKQLVAFRKALNDSIDISKADIITINNKLDEITAGTPDVLDNFKAIIDLINALDKENADNLLLEIAGIKTKINQVEADCITNDTLHTERMNSISNIIEYNQDSCVAKDTLLEGLIIANRASCESELLAEVDLRKSNDIEIREESITIRNISSSTEIYADGSWGNFGGNGFVNPRNFSISGIYVNVHNSTVFIHTQLPVFEYTKLKDISNLFCSVAIIKNTALPKLAVYTKVKKDGTDISPWYNKALIFEVANPTSLLVNSTTNMKSYQLYADIHNKNKLGAIPNYYQTRVKMTLAAESVAFYNNISLEDEVHCVTILTDKGRPQEYEFIYNRVGLCTTNGTMINDFDDLANYLYTNGVSTTLSTYTSTLTGTVNALSSSINKKVDDLAIKQAADKDLLEKSIAATQTLLTTKVNDEYLRAKAAEDALDLKINTHIGNYNTNNTNVASRIDAIEDKHILDNQARVDRDAVLLQMIKDNEDSFLRFVQWFTEVGKYTNVPCKFPFNRQDSTHK
jgi:hypothetical protein